MALGLSACVSPPTSRTAPAPTSTATATATASATATATATDVPSSPWALASGGGAMPENAPTSGWEHQRFPGKAPTQFSYQKKDGRHAVLARAQSSASMKRLRLQIAPEALGSLQFSWQVPALISQADLTNRDLDDAPVRVVLVFDGDRSRFSARDALLSELARSLTGEEMPYATLMYVWCNACIPGQVIHNPRTNRIRKLALESGPGRLGRWVDYERDIRADYLRAFGEAPGALIGVGIMSDTDNTRSHAQAWYGPLRLQRASRAH